LQPFFPPSRAAGAVDNGRIWAAYSCATVRDLHTIPFSFTLSKTFSALMKKVKNCRQRYYFPAFVGHGPWRTTKNPQYYQGFFREHEFKVFR
jgi:hypothetical protein